jgi:hypothetical protein
MHKMKEFRTLYLEYLSNNRLQESLGIRAIGLRVFAYTRCTIYEPIFAYTSSFLSQTDRCSRRLFSGSNGKIIFVLRVFALRAVLEDRMKLVNRGIPVYMLVRAKT